MAYGEDFQNLTPRTDALEFLKCQMIERICRTRWSKKRRVCQEAEKKLHAQCLGARLGDGGNFVASEFSALLVFNTVGCLKQTAWLRAIKVPTGPTLTSSKSLSFQRNSFMMAWLISTYPMGAQYIYSHIWWSDFSICSSSWRRFVDPYYEGWPTRHAGLQSSTSKLGRAAKCFWPACSLHLLLPAQRQGGLALDCQGWAIQ